MRSRTAVLQRRSSAMLFRCVPLRSYGDRQKRWRGRTSRREGATMSEQRTAREQIIRFITEWTHAAGAPLGYVRETLGPLLDAYAEEQRAEAYGQAMRTALPTDMSQERARRLLEGSIP